MEPLKGFWRRGQVVLLENGKANFNRVYHFYKESERDRRSEYFEIEDGDIVVFEPKIIRGENYATNIKRTSKRYHEISE